MKKLNLPIRIICAFLVTALFLGAVAILCRALKTNPNLIDPYNYNYSRFDDDANFRPTVVDDSNWEGEKSTAVTNGYEMGTSKATQTADYIDLDYPRTVPTETKDERETFGATAYPTWGRGIAHTQELLLALRQESRALTPSPTWHSLNLFDAIDENGYLIKTVNNIRYKLDSENNLINDEGNIAYNFAWNPSNTERNKYTFNNPATTPAVGELKKLYKHTSAVGMYGGDVSDDEPAVVKTLTYISRAGMASNQITGLYAPAGEVVKIEISAEDLAAIGGTLRVYIGQNYNLDQQVSMEDTGNGVKGNGLNRMTDILSSYNIRSTTAYVGSFLGGPIYVRPLSNNVARNFSVTISGAVKYQHFILGATTQEEYELNKASSAPYFDLEIYDQALRFTTTKHTASGGKYLRDFTYQDCTDGAVLWDKISQVSTRVQGNGLTSSTVPIMAIGDCYIAAGAAFANPGRNGIVCPPDWLAGALNYKGFVTGGNWGFIHEYNHCWQGYGVGNGGEVTNNAVSLVSYSLYTKISAARTINWREGGWNRYTDPSIALATLLNGSSRGNKYYDLPLYATLLHNIGQESYITAAHRGSYFTNLVNATHYDMNYYFTEIMNFDIGSSNSTGVISKSEVDAAKAKNYPMFVPVSSVYQVGRSILYDNEKRYFATAQPFAYGSGEYVLDFNNYNNFSKGQFNSTNLVIPDGFTVSVVSVTQPENGTTELLGGNKVKYTPNDEIYSGNFRVKLRIIDNSLRFIVEDVDLVINLKQTNVLQRTTYTYDEENMIMDASSVYNAQTNTFDFGDYNWTETINNICTQESNCQIWGAGRNYYDYVYDANSTNYKELPVGQTIQTLEGCLLFSSPGTYRFALKGRGNIALYLSFNKGQTWDLAVSMDQNSTSSFINGNWKDYTLTGTSNWVYFKAVLVVKNNWIDFFGVGAAVQNTEGEFGNIINANAYRNEEFHSLEVEKFQTDYFFTRNYTYTHTETYNSGTIVSNSPTADGENNAIQNMLDGNSSTATQSNYIPTAANPWEVTVDLGKTITANRFTMTGFLNNGQSNQNQTPTSFDVFVGDDVDNMRVIGSFVNGAVNGITTAFGFETQSFRYYKIVVTKTVQGRYVRISSITFTNNSTASVVAPNDFYVRYIGNSWKTENVLCSFGMIYTANAGDSVELHFTGSRFAYFAYQSQDYGTVNIYLDNKLIASNVSLQSDKNVGTLTYLYSGETLTYGEHILKIVGNTGSFNVDSFAVWN